MAHTVDASGDPVTEAYTQPSFSLEDLSKLLAGTLKRKPTLKELDRAAAKNKRIRRAEDTASPNATARNVKHKGRGGRKLPSMGLPGVQAPKRATASGARHGTRVTASGALSTARHGTPVEIPSKTGESITAGQ